MIRKRRSTVYVQPGKDVTLYVPSDTPPEVCAYLNQLKADGVFSQGVIEILTKHIMGSDSQASAPADVEVDPWVDTRSGPPSPLAGSAGFAEGVTAADPDAPHRLRLDQILRQARKNAGKLTGSGEV